MRGLCLPVIFIWFLATQVVSGQSVRQPSPVSLQSLGGTGVAFQDAAALVFNPALLVFGPEKHFRADAQRFYNSPLYGLQTQFAAHGKKSGWGARIEHLSWNGFREQVFQGSYGRKLTEDWSMGLSVSLKHWQWAEYGYHWQPGVQLGISGKLTPQLLVGASVADPFEWSNEFIANNGALIRAGLVYQVSEKLSALLDIKQEGKQPLAVHTGLLYQPVASVQIKTGYSSNPHQWHLGFGYLFRDIAIDASISIHPTLGAKAGLGIQYQW